MYYMQQLKNLMFKVYRYDGLAAGIWCHAITGKDIVMNGNTYIYNGNLYLTVF